MAEVARGGLRPVHAEHPGDIEAALRIEFAHGKQAAIKDEPVAKMAESGEGPAKLKEVRGLALGKVKMGVALDRILIKENG